MLRFPYWLRRLVAGPDLDELERWRMAHSQASQWFVDFPDARDVLRWVHDGAKGKECLSIYQLRDLARARADRTRGARLTDHRIDL